LAPQLEALITDERIETGYRVEHPHLDIKIRAPQALDLTELISKIEALIAPYSLGSHAQSAAQQLLQYLRDNPTNLTICDHATKGTLANRLLHPDNIQWIEFVEQCPTDHDHLCITIDGLDRYWQGEPPSGDLSVRIMFTEKNQSHEQMITFPFRHMRIMAYVVEWLCQQILQHLNEDGVKA